MTELEDLKRSPRLALVNVLWLIMKHTGVPLNATTKNDLYMAICDIEDESVYSLEHSIRRIIHEELQAVIEHAILDNTEYIVQKTVEHEVRNLLAEIRLSKGKIDEFNDHLCRVEKEVAMLHREAKEKNADS